jgi:hypothetical protein
LPRNTAERLFPWFSRSSTRIETSTATLSSSSALARLSRRRSPVAQLFPELTAAELSQALQVATAAVEKKVLWPHY